MTGNVTTTYRAKNLGELADDFDERAKACRDRAEAHKTLRQRAVARAQADTWEHAAYILRRTTLGEPETPPLGANDPDELP